VFGPAASGAGDVVFGYRRGPQHQQLPEEMKKMRGPQDSGVGG